MTIPDFAVRAWTYRQQMGAETIGFLPIVSGNDRASWESYVIENHVWVREAQAWEKSKTMSISSSLRTRSLRGHEIAWAKNEDNFFSMIDEDYEEATVTNRRLDQEVDFSEGVSDHIYMVVGDVFPVVDEGNGPYTPVWMTSPAPTTNTTLNFNLLSHQVFWKPIDSLIGTKRAVLSEVLNLETNQISVKGAANSQLPNEPISAIFYPVFEGFAQDRNLVGILATELSWSQFFSDILPSNAQGITCVVENACSQVFTYKIDGGRVSFLGPGDLHDPTYDHLVQSSGIQQLIDVPADFAGVRLDVEHCPFTLHLYPSGTLQRAYHSALPIILASAVFAIFLVFIALFIVYDRMNSRKKGSDGQNVVVIERMFPQSEVIPPLKKQLLRRLRGAKKTPNYKPGAAPPHFKATIRALPDVAGIVKEQGDPFSNATVMFADIIGLETWRKKRRPNEKVHLLETIHRSMNVIAKRHGIYQVEMAGDCYVAVTGVQDVEGEHAVTMANFVCECRKRMFEVLEGISAKGLCMRFGIHSGHVQAGLFGDESARFQLFGDTVDTTYQILMNGKPNKVHVSVETAELLNLAGKSHWLSPRKELVPVRGKGEMSTFWIKPKVCLADEESKLFAKTDASVCSESTADESEGWFEQSDIADLDRRGSAKIETIVERNVTVLKFYLKKIQARRAVLGPFGRKPSHGEAEIGMGDPIIEEARELVSMPLFDPSVATNTVNVDLLELPEAVESQLQLYVSSIASTYRDNLFHNAEHATYATVNMDKMIRNILASDEPETYVDADDDSREATVLAEELDRRTFGIASDPLTQFALVLSALVHDVDHVGVSNHQLAKEKAPIAGLYKNKSVAEQNSVDIAWWLLMTPNFSDLRRAIYSDAVEMRRLRQLLVNTVIATDILDRDLKSHRDRMWNKAFRKQIWDANPVKFRDLQASTVIEHVAQAADVVHTIQGFRTYTSWSEKMFQEMYQAYHAGRAAFDPSANWYIRELAFFDKFVIPLTKKLRDSGVFGSFGDEYVKNAKENRRQWELRGKGIMNEMLESYSKKVVAAQEDTIMFT